MSDRRDDDEKEDPAEQLKQGIGLLWRAARGAAANIRKTDVGKSLDDAGRELARAASSVADRIATEFGGPTGKHDARPEPPPTAPPAGTSAAPSKEDDDDEFDGVKVPEKKPTDGAPTGDPVPGRAPEDPGIRIMIDDDKDKPR